MRPTARSRPLARIVRPLSSLLVAALLAALSVLLLPLGQASARTLPERSEAGTARTLNNGTANTLGIALDEESLLPPAITATKRDAMQNDVDSDGQADPGDTIRYTIVISNTGTSDATGVVVTDTVDPNTTFLPPTLRVSPVAVNEIYDAIGNTRLEVGVTATGVPAAQVPGSVMDNDFDPNGDPLTITAFDATSALGGTVVMEPDGNFHYTPPINVTGVTDSFNYTISDGSQTDNATVSINLTERVWYVNNQAAAGGDGRSHQAFDTLAEAETASSPNDYIFVHRGNGTNSGQNAGITLKNGQRLIGEDVALVVGAYNLVADGLPPTIGNATGNGVTLAQDNTVRGLTIGNTNAAALTGNNFGTLLLNNVTINTTAQAVSLTTGTANAIFLGVTSTGGANNVSLTNVAGSVDLATGALSGSTSHALLVNQGTAGIGYAGTITNSAANVVRVTNKTGGSVTLSGNVTGTGTGVFLDNNTGVTMTFRGGLVLNTGANAAFTATGGGIVNVCDDNPCNAATPGALVNTLTTTTGTALNISNTTIGISRVEFRSISSNGGGNSGIVLNNTGASNGLAVWGNGAAGTGGTIQNKTVNGISLQNTISVNLNFMNITNNDGSGIFGDDVTGFSLVSSSVTNNADTFDGSEANLRFNELLGTANISNSTIQGSSEDEIRITPASGTLTNLIVTASTIGPNSATTGGHGLAWIATGTAQGTINVTNSNFQTIRSTGALMNVSTTAVGTLNVSNSTFTDIGAAVTLQSAQSADLNFHIQNNPTILRSISNAIQLVAGSDSTTASQLNGIISGNVIGNGTPDSGSRDMFGIALDLRGDQDAVIDVSNNNVRNTDITGIWVSSADFGALAGSGQLDLTLRDNSVQNIDDNSAFPFFTVYGVLVDVRHTTNTCLDMFSNTSASVGGVEHFRLRQRDTSTFRLERLTDGDGTPNEVLNNLALIEGHIVAQNDAGSTADATLAAGFGFTEAADGACASATFTENSQKLPESERVVESDLGERIALHEAVAGTRSARTSESATEVADETIAATPAASVTTRGEDELGGAPDVTLNIAALPPGEDVIIIFDVLIDNPIAAGVDFVQNQARITGSNFGPTLTNDPDTPAPNDPTRTPIDAAPELGVTKSDGGITAVPGGVIAYTLNYNNQGNQGASNVILTDTVPANTTFNPGASSLGWACLPNNNPGSLCTLSLGTVAGGGTSGSRTFAVTVNNPVAAGVTQISNTACIDDDGTNGPDAVPGDNCSSDTTPVNANPDLQLTKSDGGISTTPGSTVVYTLNLSNIGNQGATGITLSEVVPSNSTFTSGASSPGWACVPDNNPGSTCTLTVGALAGGSASTTRLFAVTVVNPLPSGVTQIANTATTADDGSNGTDPAGNNSGSDTTPIVADPDLRITKDDGGVLIPPGNTLVYTLTYTNAGNQNAGGVFLTDTVPAVTTFNPGASTPGWTCLPNNNAGSLCTLPVGPMTAGVSGNATFAVNVSATIPGGVTQISNTACIDDDGVNGADPTPANNCENETTPIDARPDLQVTKDDGGITTTPGGVVAYTLTYSNTGNRDATNVVLTDTVPTNSTFNAGASSPGWACVGPVCTLNVGTVAQGTGGSRTFAVTVNNPVAAGVTQLTNTVAIDDDGANGTDPNPANNTDSDTTPITAAPDITLTKDDGGTTGTPGGVVAYTLSVANAGNQHATGVFITDTVPANTTFNPGASSAGWACVPNNNPGSVCTITIGALNAGNNATRTFAVTVANPVAAGVNQISNTAGADDDDSNGADPTPADNTDTDTTPITAAPDITLTKDDGGISTTPGGVVAYTLTVANAGNQHATGVFITDTVPANTTFNAGASSAGWACVPNNNPGSVCTNTIGALNAGNNATRTFAVTVASPVAAGVNQISNTAGADDDDSNGADPTPADNTDTDTTPITAAPDITLTKDDGGVSTTPGGVVAYTLTVANAGNQHATGVFITDTVPANTTFNAGASSAGWVCVPNNNPGSVCTNTIGALNAGNNATRTFAVTVALPVPGGVTQISNTAGADDDDGNGADPTPADNTDTDTTPISANPDLQLNKDDGGTTGTPGGVVAYTLTVTNMGTQDATGITLTDTVPSNSTFNAGASSPGWACVGPVCTVTIPSLAGGGGSTSRTFAVTVNSPLPAGVTQLTNNASVADDGTNGADPTPANNADSDTTPITAQPDLLLDKDDGGVTTTPGGTVAYTLAYSNIGNQDATGVLLTDTVPAHTTFNAGASSAGWACVPNNNPGSICTLTIGALAAGGSGNRTFAVTVNTPIAAGVAFISNTAYVDDDGANGADPTPINNDTDTTPVTAAPDLQLTKDDGGTTTTPGGVVAYTLTYSNVGNQDATGVFLTDTVPANTTFNAGASSAGWACVPNNNPGSVCTLTIGALASGVSGTRTFAVTVDNPIAAGVTQLSNTAHVDDDDANGTEPTPADNSDTDTTPVTATPDLQLSKDDGGVTGTPGGVVAYTLSYSNVGNQGATGVMLTETVPANTTFNPAASTVGWLCLPNGNPGSTCLFGVGAVAGGSTGNVTYAVTVAAVLPPGVTQISNSASVGDDGSNGAEPTPADNSDSDTTPLVVAADLAISKSVSTATAVPGEAISYVLTYINNGPQPSTGVTITDIVPSQLIGLSVQSSPPITLTGPLSYTWDVGTLAPGSGGTITITGVVDPALAADVTFTNTASISGTFEMTPTNNVDSVPLTVTLPRVQFSAATYSAGEASGSATITAQLDQPNPYRDVTVAYASSDGSATAGSDYTGVSGVLTFTAGMTQTSFIVPLLDDTVDETDETVLLDLSATDGAILGTPAAATLVIVDDDGTPSINFSATAYTANETDASATITVTLSNPSAATIAVDYQTADGSATAGADYTATNGTLTFPSGTMSQSFTVPLLDDALFELDETVLLSLTNPVSGTVGGIGTATLTILDNEGQPTISVGDGSVMEGDAGTTALEFTLSLDVAAGVPVTVTYSTADGTATAGSDYVAATGTAVIAAGSLTTTVDILVNGDIIVEQPDETFLLDLTNPINAQLGDAQGVGTIIDDDGATAVSLAALGTNQAGTGLPVGLLLTLGLLSLAWTAWRRRA